MTTTPSQPRTRARRRRAGFAAACLSLLTLLATGSAHAQVDGTAVEPSATPAAETAAAPAPAPEAAPAAPSRARVIEARVRPKTAYYYGLKKISFAVMIAAKGPTNLRIDIVRAGSGVLERSIFRNNVSPKTRVVIPWDGLSGSGTVVRGKLRFIVRGAAGKPIPFARRYTASGKGGPKVRFGYFDHIFPVRGKHSYGDGLGAGRGHQGQDIAAACGTDLVAAQAGTIQTNAYQAEGAGYYLVIDEVGSEIDTVYMHLAAPSALVAGSVAMTGQIIGEVGSTGRSTGCHLHFEMWAGPGWYAGGALMDPAPFLRAWDKYS